MAAVESYSRVRLPADPAVALDAATRQYVDSRPTGGQTVNYYQPLVNETFSATAGSSQTFTLANTNYGIQLVFINGQALQASEYSSTSTQLTVTPVDGPLVTGDAVVAVYAKANVFSGTYADDIEITNAAKGVILRDRVNGGRYRLFMSGGVLGTEAVT